MIEKMNWIFGRFHGSEISPVNDTLSLCRLYGTKTQVAAYMKKFIRAEAEPYVPDDDPGDGSSVSYRIRTLVDEATENGAVALLSAGNEYLIRYRNEDGICYTPPGEWDESFTDGDARAIPEPEPLILDARSDSSSKRAVWLIAAGSICEGDPYSYDNNITLRRVFGTEQQMKDYLLKLIEEESPRYGKPDEADLEKLKQMNASAGRLSFSAVCAWNGLAIERHYLAVEEFEPEVLGRGHA